MTAAEKKLLQETHDSIIKLKTIIIGNGVTGLAEKVHCNSDFIAKIIDLPKQIENNRKAINEQKERYDKTYYKLVGGGIVVVAIAEVISKILLKL